MTILLTLAAAWAVTSAAFAVFLGRLLRQPTPQPEPSWVPDTADEFLELSR